MSKTLSVPKAAETETALIDLANLRPDSRQLRIIEANLDGEPMRVSDLVKVKTPSAGGTTWIVPTNGNDVPCDEIVGLCVCIAKHGTIWPYDDPTDTKPVIVSTDLVTGYRVSDQLGSIDPKALEKYRTGDRRYDWVAMSNSPEFGSGSGKNGQGKKAKESRIVAILRDGDVWPVLVTIGPGSIVKWGPFQKTLPSFHFECVIGLSLEKAKSKGGQPYSMIVPRVVGLVSEAQGEVARRIYTEPLKAMFNATPGAGGAAAAAVVDAEDE
jgi:hypothetical protein